MTNSTLRSAQVAPFDSLASSYDDLFTNSLIGRAQRGAVWRHIDSLWQAGDRILELNCGTGEDALHLARHGISVVACDASGAMVEVATHRKRMEAPDASIEFHTLANECLDELRVKRQFDGVLSNFSGLNCASNIGVAARQLAALARPGAPMALCLSTRYCAWEFIWYALRGQWKTATRRWKGHTSARVGEQRVDVYYPTIRELRNAFAPWFELEVITGIGVSVPPSYVETWARRYPSLLLFLQQLDRVLERMPLFRSIGDHVLLRFRRCAV